jgi:flagellar motor protein MotB
LEGFKRQSAWRWETSAGDSAGGTVFGPISAGLSRGEFIVTSPTKARVTFSYTYGGAGPGIGYKLGASHSTEDTWSSGDIYLSDRFSGPDLSNADFTGLCLVDELSGGIGLGGAVTIMRVGIPAKDMLFDAAKSTGGLPQALRLAREHSTLLGLGLTRFILNHLCLDPQLDPRFRRPDPPLFDQAMDALGGALQSDAKALVIIKGFNSGPQITVGMLQGMGYIKMVAAKPPPPPPDPEDLVIVRKVAQGLSLHLPNDVLFDFDKSTIKPTAVRVLNQVAWAIAELNPPGSRISVEGHTDGIGNPDYNTQLSLQPCGIGWSHTKSSKPATRRSSGGA